MKKILFITGLLWAIFQFTPQMEVDTDSIPLNHQEAVVKEKNDMEDMHYRIEKISKDLRNSNFLTPRRTVQPFSLAASQRVVPEVVRIIQYIRIKGAEQLRKVSEFVTRIETINHSALLTRMGYHVYALREIII